MSLRKFKRRGKKPKRSLVFRVLDLLRKHRLADKGTAPTPTGFRTVGENRMPLVKQSWVQL